MIFVIFWGISYAIESSCSEDSADSPQSPARRRREKDELIFEGNSVDCVSGTCAAVKDSTLVREKDIRKFLDGLYVSEKNSVSLM